MAYLDQALTIIFLVGHILWSPVSTLIASLTFLLAPFYRVTVFLLLPFTHAAHVLTNVLSFPFTVKWLERIETLYVYLGTAALIGCITGGILYTIMRVLSSTLNINPSSAMPKPRQKSRTVAEYRATKAVNKEGVFDQTPSIPPVIMKKVPEFRRRKGLLSSAIIEEEDSDF